MTAYYNENNPEAAAWLRDLIAAGHIAPGDVDTRSIEDVHPDDLRPYLQCHFFAGIGIWSHALRLAGWPDDRRVWTGSCPCQPFSAAGKGGGFADERHLWPAWFHLITQCRPERIYGEQVASRDGLAWLDLVLPDLEGAGYAAGAVDLCAAGVGAPHIRQRLWISAQRLEHAPGNGREQRRPESDGGGAIGAPRRLASPSRTGLEGLGRGPTAQGGRNGTIRPIAPAGESGRVDDTDRSGSLARQRDDSSSRHGLDAGAACSAFRLADADSIPCDQGRAIDGGRDTRSDALARPGPGCGDVLNGGRPGPTNGHWRAADWLACRDGKWRPVEPGAQPLAHGVAGRVGLLRGYGNGIVAQAAEAVIRASM